MTNVNDRCMSVKSSMELDLQCPYKSKIGEYCGIHHRSKKIIRVDDRPSTEHRIIINLTFKKLQLTSTIMPIVQESEYYDDIDYLTNSLTQQTSKQLNYGKLIKTLRHYQIQVDGNKEELIKKLIQHMKDQTLIAQARINPDLCNNTNDFYDFVDLKDIPDEYLFIFKCQDGLLYGMDLRSMHSYFQELEKDAKLMERPISYQNPYNRCKLSSQTICAYRNAIEELEKRNRPIKYPDEEHNPDDKVTFKVLEVFHTIYNYGYAVDGSWFLKMNKADLLDYYWVMEDIWNHRLNLSLATKRNIVPDNINIFNKTEYNEIREYDKVKLQEFMIDKISQMINSGENRESRILGIHYTLIGLGEVCEIDSYLPFGDDE